MCILFANLAEPIEKRQPQYFDLSSFFYLMQTVLWYFVTKNDDKCFLPLHYNCSRVQVNAPSGSLTVPPTPKFRHIRLLTHRLEFHAKLQQPTKPQKYFFFILFYIYRHFRINKTENICLFQIARFVKRSIVFRFKKYFPRRRRICIIFPKLTWHHVLCSHLHGTIPWYF